MKDNKFEYWKKKLIGFIDDKIKEAEKIEKSFRLGFWLEKANRSHLVPKTITKTNPKTGKTYTAKVWVNPNKENGKKVYRKDSKGARISLGKLRKSLEKCTTSQELMQIVLQNKSRFSDENGRPLPMIQEFSKYVSKLNDDFEAMENESEKHQNRSEAMKGNQNAKKDFTEADKKKAREQLKENAVEMMNVPYDRKEYEKLFPRGEIKTPFENVKLGEHQFERLGEKDAGTRKNLIGAMYQTLKEPCVVLEDVDKQGREAKLYIKSFIGEDKKKYTFAVVVDIEGKPVSVSFGSRKEKQVLNKIKTATRFYYVAADSPTIGTGTEKPLPNDSNVTSKPGSVNGTSMQINETPEDRAQVTQNKAAQKEKPKAEKKESSKGISKADREEMKYIKKQVDYISDALENLTEKNLTDVGISIESIEASLGRLSENFSGKTALKNIIEEIKQDFVKKLQSKKLKNAVNRDYYLNKYKKELELQTAYRIKNQQPHSAQKPLANVRNVTAPMSSISTKPDSDNKEPSKEFAPSTSTDYDSFTPITENKSIGEGKVQLKYSREVADQLKKLVKNVSKDTFRPYITNVFYSASEGSLVATNGRTMRIVKVGRLEGLEENCFVDVDVSKDSITVSRKDKDPKETPFPNYRRVVPQSQNHKFALDNKALKAKINEMKDSGAVFKKEPQLVFELQGNDIVLDGVKIGECAGKPDFDKFAINYEYIKNALTGNTSYLMANEAEKAMTIATGSTLDVIMPMNKETHYQNYEANRKAHEERRKSVKKSVAAVLEEMMKREQMIKSAVAGVLEELA